MSEKSESEIKAGIAAKRAADQKKLKTLSKVAVAGVFSRLLISVLPWKFSSLLIELLWVPLLLLLLALPFYAFERLLDRSKKRER